MITDMYEVANTTWTCLGCPMQAEGQLTDGRWYYFRYRFGYARLGLGATLDAAIGDPEAAGRAYGDGWQGVLGTEEAETLLLTLIAERLLQQVIGQDDEVTP